MSTTTTNYGLVKPELTDAADITAMNPNWDTIDAELKEHADHTHTASDVGALPISGGLLTGSLYLTSSQVQVGGNSNAFLVSASPSGGSNYRQFQITNTDYMPSLDNAVRLRTTESGEATVYRIYGEHNVTKGTTDLTAGTSPLADGCIHIVYE